MTMLHKIMLMLLCGCHGLMMKSTMDAGGSLASTSSNTTYKFDSLNLPQTHCYDGRDALFKGPVSGKKECELLCANMPECWFYSFSSAKTTWCHLTETCNTHKTITDAVDIFKKRNATKHEKMKKMKEGFKNMINKVTDFFNETGNNMENKTKTKKAKAPKPEQSGLVEPKNKTKTARVQNKAKTKKVKTSKLESAALAKNMPETAKQFANKSVTLDFFKTRQKTPQTAVQFANRSELVKSVALDFYKTRKRLDELNSLLAAKRREHKGRMIQEKKGGAAEQEAKERRLRSAHEKKERAIARETKEYKAKERKHRQPKEKKERAAAQETEELEASEEKD